MTRGRRAPVGFMGCVVNGPGESKHADIGISLPGTFEEPGCARLHRRRAGPHPARRPHRRRVQGDPGQLRGAALPCNRSRLGTIGRDASGSRLVGRVPCKAWSRSCSDDQRVATSHGPRWGSVVLTRSQRMAPIAGLPDRIRRSLAAPALARVRIGGIMPDGTFWVIRGSCAARGRHGP